MPNDLYDFKLPDELIAQKPARPRDHARLLVYSLADGTITDDKFFNLEKYLPAGATIAMNNSKVEHCRWLFDEGKTEIFVLEKNDPRTVRAMVRPGRKFRLGETLQLTDWLTVEVLAVDEEGIRTLRLSSAHNDERLKAYEHVPLPPYIKQDDELAEEYQTVYAKPEGSLAAPTAGLHFTPELLQKIGQTHQLAEVTLHVGLGTFAKLTDENIKSGRLHEELFVISPPEFAKIQDVGHITAVGTTTTRLLESISDISYEASTISSTDIFIQPGYKFKAVDSLMTNFHLPSTSLLMLVSAFIADKRGLDEAESAAELMRVYKHAIDKKYHFYSFGDAMLLV